MPIRSPGMLPRETSPGKPLTLGLQQEVTMPFCPLVNVSAHFCHSPAHVTGDSTLCSVTVHLSPLAMLGAVTASEPPRGLAGSFCRHLGDRNVEHASGCCTRRHPPPFPASLSWCLQKRIHQLVPQWLSNLHSDTYTGLCLTCGLWVPLSLSGI